jgi:hypothetical protein
VCARRIGIAALAFQSRTQSSDPLRHIPLNWRDQTGVVCDGFALSGGRPAPFISCIKCCFNRSGDAVGCKSRLARSL